MQNIRNFKEYAESTENSSNKANKHQYANQFTTSLFNNTEEEPISKNNSYTEFENNYFHFSLENSENSNSKTFLGNNHKKNLLNFNNSNNHKDISNEPSYSSNMGFKITNENKINKNNFNEKDNSEDNYFKSSCKSESDVYEKSFGNSNSNYFDLGRRHFENNAMFLIQDEIEAEAEEGNFIDRNLICANNSFSENMQIHNIIFTERNDGKEANEDSDFFKNDYFFTKNTSIQEELNINTSNKMLWENQALSNNKTKNDFDFSNLKSGLKTNKRKENPALVKDTILKDIDKIYSLINSLFLSQITSYDKFILIYKIENILIQKNNFYKILILEILEKYQGIKTNAKNSNIKQDLKRDFNKFKEDVANVYENYSDAKLNLQAEEELIEKKKIFVTKTIKIFTKFLKRNNFVILKNSDL